MREHLQDMEQAWIIERRSIIHGTRYLFRLRTFDLRDLAFPVFVFAKRELTY